VTAVRVPAASVRPSPAWGVAVVGVVALLARPWFLPAGVDVEWRVAFFVALGLAAVWWPVGAPDRAGPGISLFVLGVGAAGFVAGRALLDDVPVVAGSLALAVALNALAAVAEEAFFRRLAYGWLLRWGTVTAVVGSAVLFAVAHVTVWGFGVLPLDLAAGLLLSWQRAASGQWSVPAATHVVANSLALL
jgi:membrane protease YdiL (CAAX protease family)